MGGEKAKKSGDSFEKHLKKAHALYAEKGIARIHKLPVPTIWQPQGMVRVAKQRYDYDGEFGPCGAADHTSALHGRKIAMEAKSDSKPAKSLPCSHFSDKQLNSLIEAARWGIPATIVWRTSEFRGVILPDAWPEVMEVLETRKSIPMVLFTPYELFSYDGVEIEDWLWPIREWMGRCGNRMSLGEAQYGMEQKPFTWNVQQVGGVTMVRVMFNGEKKMVEVPHLVQPVRIDEIGQSSATAKEFIGRLESLKSANE